MPLTASAAEATIFEKEELLFAKRELRFLRDLRECMMIVLWKKLFLKYLMWSLFSLIYYHNALGFGAFEGGNNIAWGVSDRIDWY